MPISELEFQAFIEHLPYDMDAGVQTLVLMISQQVLLTAEFRGRWLDQNLTSLVDLFTHSQGGLCYK